MKKISLAVLCGYLIILLATIFFVAYEKKSPPSITTLDIADKASHIIHVLATGTQATVSMHEKRSNGEWYVILQTDGYVGSNGVGPAYEGSKMTPAGIFSLTRAFGILPNPGTILPYTQVDNSHYWVDDIHSPHYNKFVTTRTTPVDWKSAEHLIDHNIAYAYAIALDYNTQCKPGAGSAIFLHCINKPYTPGCIAVPQDAMRKILKKIKHDAYIFIQNADSCTDSNM